MGARHVFFILAAFGANLSFSIAAAAPGDTIYAEDFQSGSTSGWTYTDGNGSVTVGEYPPGSGELALTTCCGSTVVISPVINTGFSGAQLALRIQRGGTAIGSDTPDNNEYFELYFLDSAGNWQFARRYSGNETAAETINDSFTLTGSLLHAGFRIRLEQRNGDSNADFWHLHELSIIEAGASGSIGSLCDDFSGGLARWTVNSFGGSAAVIAGRLAIFDGSARLHSLPLDLAGVTAAALNLRVQRGGDAFSEDPDGGEDLVIGYLDVNGDHQQLQVLAGDGAPGETFDLPFVLPAGALHDAFQVRIERYGGGVGGYWHIDDVCVDIQRSVDHFAIRHDGSGVNCQAEPVEIVAHDVNHFIVENYTGGIGLSTSTGHGDWSVLDGNGALANTGSGNGGYVYAATDRGAALLGLRDTFVETLNVNAGNGIQFEAPAEDNSLAFNATGFNVLVNGGSVPVPAQIAGKPSDVSPNATAIELQAIRTDDDTGACEAAFTGNVSIDLAFSCENPDSCAGSGVTVNGSNVAANSSGAPTAFTTLALDFGSASDNTAPLIVQYDNAGLITLHARHTLPPSGEIMSGSSNAFVVRPFGFHVSAANNPGAVDANGSVYRKTGESLAVMLRSVGWQASDDINADGAPDGYGNMDPADNADLSDNPVLANFGNEVVPDVVTLSANLAAPVAGTNPGLQGDTSVTGFVNGTAITTVGFSEAGIIELVATLVDGDYLGSGNTESRSGFVGRFIPDHFDVAVQSHGCNDAIGFSYSGQPFRKLVVAARNASSGLVRNFDGALGFAKNVTLSEISGADGGVINGDISALDFVNGVATILDAPMGVGFRFTDRETPPVLAALRATDSDGVSSLNHAEGQSEIRSGRFVIEDASAPVLGNAASALRVETFEDGGWQPEPQDVCSGFHAALLSLDGHAGNLAAGESIVGDANFSNGSGEVTLTAPGTGNDGAMVLHYDADAWLEYDWLGAGPDDPFGTIRFFGIFATEPGLIQRHEVVP